MQRHAPIPLLLPDVPAPQALLPYLQRMHAARHYSNFGPLVRELEAMFAERFGQPVDHVTTVSNATQGLELVLQALELPPRSRILVPTLTFVATATAVVRAGHVPVLADVDAESWLLTPQIARAACQRTAVQAVLPVATFGMPQDMQAWQQFELDTGLPVVVDAAGAYGSQWLQQSQGTLVFSLHATKSLAAGEGGLVVSTREGLAARVRQLSNFGINLDPAAAVPVGSLAAMGTNAKMSEFHAATGLAALQCWAPHAAQRLALFARLRQALDDAAGGRLTWQAEGPGGGLVAPSLLCVRLPDERMRERLEACCAGDAIATRRWYQPLLQHMARLRSHCDILPAPAAQAIGRTTIGLPFFLGLTDAQEQRIANAMRVAVLSGA